jgi:hypothetical protein
MLPEAALRALGLEPGATDDEIAAAILAQQSQGGDGDGGDGDGGEGEGEGTDGGDPGTEGNGEGTEGDGTGDGETAAPTAPEGMMLVDSEQWRTVMENVAASAAERQQRADEHRDRVLASAVTEGKFPRTRLQHYATMWSADPVGTEALIKDMAPGLIPVVERGTAEETGEQVAASQYPASWGRRVQANNKNTAGAVKVVND